MDEKPGMTPVEQSVLEKAKKAKQSGQEVRLTGAEADAARSMLGNMHSWGGKNHRPDWHPHYRRGPYVDGYWEGRDFVLGGITAAGLMVLQDWLDRDSQPASDADAAKEAKEHPEAPDKPHSTDHPEDEDEEGDE
jgi:hypothetical protein